MRFTTTLFALLATAASVHADAAAIKTQLSLISNLTTLLNSDASHVVDTVNTLPWCLQTQLDSVLIQEAVIEGIALSQQSGKFQEPDSLEIALTLLNLSSVVTNALDTIDGKRSGFGDLSPIVLATLYSLKNATDVFANVTIAKFQPLEASIAPSVVQNLNAAFNKAITTYGGQGESAQELPYKRNLTGPAS